MEADVMIFFSYTHLWNCAPIFFLYNEAADFDSLKDFFQL